MTLFSPFVMCMRPVALTKRGSYPRSQVGRTKTGTQSHSLSALFSFCFFSLPTCATSFLSSAFSLSREAEPVRKAGLVGGSSRLKAVCGRHRILYARPIWKLGGQQVWRGNRWFFGMKSCWLPHWVLFRLFYQSRFLCLLLLLCYQHWACVWALHVYT